MRLSSLVLTIAALSVPNAASATSYSVVSGFSTASNPSGVWTYAYGTPSSYALDPVSGNNYDGNANSMYWSIAPNGLPVVAYNPAGISFSTLTVPSTELLIHPGPSPADYDSLVIFTAPTSGNYDLNYSFTRRDNTTNGNGVIVGIAVNGVTAASDYLAPMAGASFADSGSGYLAAGETVEFFVNNNGEYTYDSTGLSATFSSTPEPSSLALLGTGLVGAAGVLRRRFVR